jgi:hypothetical protein
MVTLVRLADGFGIKMADLFVATQVTKTARAR